MIHLLPHQEDEVERRLFGRIAESPYLLVVNGFLLKHSGKPIQVALRSKKITFFYKESSQEHHLPEHRRGEILAGLLDNEYGEYDFNSHILEKQKQAAYSYIGEVEEYELLIPSPLFDNTLRMIIIETHIFQLLRSHEENPQGGTLMLKDGSGEFLNGRQMTALRMEFITNGIMANIDITKTVFMNRIGRVIDHEIFSPRGEFFLALVKHNNLHNPWIDSVRLSKDVEAYPLFKLLSRRLKQDPRSQHSTNVITNLKFAYITHTEASAHMGLETKFPFSYTIFQNLLAGLVLDPLAHNFKFPSTKIPMFVYVGPSEEREEYSQYLNAKQYLALSDYDREVYAQANSTVVLINANEAFFKTKRISETRSRITKNMRLYESLAPLQLRVEDVWSES